MVTMVRTSSCFLVLLVAGVVVASPLCVCAFSGGAYPNNVPGPFLPLDPIPDPETDPKAFVQDVIVPWCERSREIKIRIREPLSPEYEASITRNAIDYAGAAAVRYEYEIGIPSHFIQDWYCYRDTRDVDGDEFMRERSHVFQWGLSQHVSVEGGKFPWLVVYCQIVRTRIKSCKEAYLDKIESSETLTLPSELTGIPRADLIDSHLHDATIQRSMATLPGFTHEYFPQRIYDDPIWFVTINEIRTEYYFPRHIWENHPKRKELENIFYIESIFGTSRRDRDHYRHIKLHLVRHLDEWRENLDLIPDLYHQIALPLLDRHKEHFLTDGAVDLEPKELLRLEPEAILDFPFDGLYNLNDTTRVKVLRTEREFNEMEIKLNITHVHHMSGMEHMNWEASKSVAVVLLDHQEGLVALAEFAFNGVTRNRGFHLGRGSSAMIKMKNEHKAVVDEELVDLCQHFHDQFLYPWRVETLEKENPEWYQRVKQRNSEKNKSNPSESKRGRLYI